MDTFTSLIAGITVFSVMGYLSVKTKKNIHEILHGGGSGIAFIAYPTAIAEFTYPQVNIRLANQSKISQVHEHDKTGWGFHYFCFF